VPELPEVETVKRSLQQSLVGRVINGIEIRIPKIIKAPSQEEFQSLLEERMVEGVDRRGKYLLIQLSGGLVLVVHLRMTGRLFVCPPSLDQDRHTHVLMDLDNGWQLRFEDQRQFGTMHLLPSHRLGEIRGLAAMGWEPLDRRFSPTRLGELCGESRRRIKDLLLDQSVVAGIGNIYADEILFAAGIHPGRIAATLGEGEIQALHSAMGTVLRAAIRHRGTSVRDYVDGAGVKGSYQHHLKVYRCTGMPCPRCGRPIEKIRVAGRSSHYCAHCQK